MRNKFLVIIILSACILSSCLKDRLKGDAEVIVGEWEWIETNDYSAGGSGNTWTHQTPNSTGLTYSILFEKKGKATLFQNGEEIRESRIKYNYFEDNLTVGISRWWEFQLHLKGGGSI